MSNDPELRVAVVEDDARYRESLEMLLGHAQGVVCASSYGSAPPVCEAAKAAYERGASAPWDLVLMDIELPEINGIEATSRLKELFPGVPVIVLTVFEEPSTILEAICAGADGYLLKKTAAGELIRQLHVVARGGSPLTPEIARSVLDVTRRMKGPPEPMSVTPSRLDLTEREQDVLRCLVDGKSYQQSAATLGISTHTVRDHVRGVYRKLQVHNVAQAVTRAVREGLV
jgi:DNA-binding NarL/FixJ family response regulator